MLKKISTAAARDCSYKKAAQNLNDLAELTVSSKQCQRVAIRIGSERLDEQSERIARYSQATLPEQSYGQPDTAPKNDWSSRVAVIQSDGGRVQIRDELWGIEKTGDKKHRWWRETQAGCLQTYLSKPTPEDPHPEVPQSLKDALWIVPKFKEIHRQHASSNSAEATGSDSCLRAQENERSTSMSDIPIITKPADKVKGKVKDTRWSGGDTLVKTVVATRQGYDHLGLALAAEAYNRGFNKATSKAFMGDGLKVNWSLWERHFSHYVPIADLMHALSYVYAAAIACGKTVEEGWGTYLDWLEKVWAGRVLEVISEMKKLSASREANQLEPLYDLTRAITYLGNNASRMKYDEYRKTGFPITTSLVESTQKQINKRIKGTEKFWRDEHLEPLLQLIADDLSDTHDRDAFWTRRQQRHTGFRLRRRKSKNEVS